MKADQNYFLAVAEYVDLIPVFMEQLDAIYWQGYANQLHEEHPDQFNEEYQLFADLYR